MALLHATLSTGPGQVEFEVEGHDLGSLLFALLDEFLFRFSADDFMVCRKVRAFCLNLLAIHLGVLLLALSVAISCALTGSGKSIVRTHGLQPSKDLSCNQT